MKNFIYLFVFVSMLFTVSCSDDVNQPSGSNDAGLNTDTGSGTCEYEIESETLVIVDYFNSDFDEPVNIYLHFCNNDHEKVKEIYSYQVVTEAETGEEFESMVSWSGGADNPQYVLCKGECVVEMATIEGQKVTFDIEVQ